MAAKAKGGYIVQSRRLIIAREFAKDQPDFKECYEAAMEIAEFYEKESRWIQYEYEKLRALACKYNVGTCTPYTKEPTP